MLATYPYSDELGFAACAAFLAWHFWTSRPSAVGSAGGLDCNSGRRNEYRRHELRSLLDALCRETAVAGGLECDAPRVSLVRGSGAGMDPPAVAVLKNGWLPIIQTFLRVLKLFSRPPAGQSEAGPFVQMAVVWNWVQQRNNQSISPLQLKRSRPVPKCATRLGM